MTLTLRLLQTSKKHDTPVWGHASLVDADGVGVVSCNYFVSQGDYVPWTMGWKSQDPELLEKLKTAISNAKLDCVTPRAQNRKREWIEV